MVVVMMMMMMMMMMEDGVWLVRWMTKFDQKCKYDPYFWMKDS